jgi:uncharacterized protein YhbP (UPF0306 family)
MSADLVARIAAFLAEHHVLSLATHGRDGPHAANLFYAHDGLALFWVSDPDTRHSRELEADQRVAVTVAGDHTDFSDIKGVQLAGTAARIASAERRAWHLSQLAARYPFLQRLANAPPALQAAYARAAVYRFEPTRAVLIDNTKGFGHKETLDLSAGIET